ncbi:tape measure protein [Candidatus Avoscillospira sp. LCP25S3_F1]|uniref:tape measure protein n=1 Tax=Candidatus Avoscillospira sp. LCP25S3_F1 TaxID=3438825 RepID=UPI003F936915
MAEASVVATLRDAISPELIRMEQANDNFNDSLDETQRQAQQYSRRLSQLLEGQSRLQTSLSAARRELREAERAFRATGDAMDEARLEEANEEYNRLATTLSSVRQAANDTRRALYDLTEVESRRNGNNPSPNPSPDSAAGDSLLSRLSAAGATALVGDLASQAVGTLATSLGGDTMGSYVSNALSYAGMGASIGTAIAPGIGTAIGAALGGLGGLVAGTMEEYANRDEAFKSYVQDSVNAIKEERASSIQNGSVLAAQREQDALAFDQLLGKGVGASYLEDLRELSADTPMTYEGLTDMSRALATGFGDNPERMLNLMEKLGDAGSAVGIDESGMAEMAKSMSRMESSGKATLEYLNIFQERGVDVIGILSDGLGKTQGQIYDMISKSEIGGVEAVQMIENALGDMYGGAMEQQSQTFAGLSSTLEDMQAELDAASGEGYNKIKTEGMKEEIAWMDGVYGDRMKEINYAMGAWEASLENEKQKMIRDALSHVLDDDDYKALMADGSDDALAQAGEMLAAAKVQAINEYNATEGAQLMVQSELSLIETVRENTATNNAYWDAGYQLGEEFSKGRAAGMASNLHAPSSAAISGAAAPYLTASPYAAISGASSPYAANLKAHAYGLERVPYDNYPALLHEGERVLTAAEARSESRGSAVQIAKLADQIVVREDADIDRIASALVAKLQDAMLTGVP